MDANHQSAHSARWHDLLQDSIDGALDRNEQVKLDSHLQDCDACRAERAKLHALHALFKMQLGTAPALTADFSARVFASIDEQELARRATAKLRAERDFQNRLRAYEFDWRSFWQRHMGSIVAGATTIAAIAAMLSATWTSFRGQLLSAFPALAPVSMSLTATVLTTTIVVAAGAVWFLRAKAP